MTNSSTTTECIKNKSMSTTTTRNRRDRRTSTSKTTVAIFSSSSIIMSTIGFVTTLLLLLCCSSHGLGDKTSELPLYEDTPTHCDEMVDLHRWEGTCCSLNVTEGEGCILNVRDGYCKIRGQIWTLNYTSTSDIPCPPSEYSPEMLGMKPKPAPSSTEGSGGPGNTYYSINKIGIIIMSLTAAAVAVGTSFM